MTLEPQWDEREISESGSVESGTGENMASDVRKVLTLSKPELIAMLAMSVARVVTASSKLGPENHAEAMKAVLKEEVGKVMRIHPNIDMTALSDAIKALVGIAGEQELSRCECVYP